MATRSISIIANQKRKVLLVVSVFYSVNEYIKMNLDVDIISLFSSKLSFNLLYIFFFSNFYQISIINHSNRLFRFIIQSIKSSLHHYHHQYQSKLSIILEIYIYIIYILLRFKKKRKIPLLPLVFSILFIIHIRTSRNI